MLVYKGLYYCSNVGEISRGWMGRDLERGERKPRAYGIVSSNNKIIKKYISIPMFTLKLYKTSISLLSKNKEHFLDTL